MHATCNQRQAKNHLQLNQYHKTPPFLQLPCDRIGAGTIHPRYLSERRNDKLHVGL